MPSTIVVADVCIVNNNIFLPLSCTRDLHIVFYGSRDMTALACPCQTMLRRRCIPCVQSQIKLPGRGGSPPMTSAWRLLRGGVRLRCASLLSCTNLCITITIHAQFGRFTCNDSTTLYSTHKTRCRLDCIDIQSAIVNIMHDTHTHTRVVKYNNNVNGLV
jgi:hypothetical protein